MFFWVLSFSFMWYIALCLFILSLCLLMWFLFHRLQVCCSSWFCCVPSGGSIEGFLIDLDRVKGILAFPAPKTKRELGFLGLAGYCRNWVPNFSLITQPLYNLLKQDQPEPLCWNVEHSEAVETTKNFWPRPQPRCIQIMIYLSSTFFMKTRRLH